NQELTARSAPEAREERTGERRAAAALLVFEVGIDPLPAARLAHARRPGVEVSVRVVRAAQAQVAEGRSRHEGRRQRLAVRDAERGVVPGEGGVGLIAEPARVAELEGRREAGRQLLEKGREPLDVEAEVGRQLEEQGPELLAERGGELAEALDRLPGVAQ